MLSSTLKSERTWRTREDPFEKEWPEIAERLVDAPELLHRLAAIMPRPYVHRTGDGGAQILTHLGLPASSPQLAPARLPRELSFDFEGDDPRSSEADDAEPPATATARSEARGPPECDSGL